MWWKQTTDVAVDRVVLLLIACFCLFQYYLHIICSGFLQKTAFSTSSEFNGIIHRRRFQSWLKKIPWVLTIPWVHEDTINVELQYIKWLPANFFLRKISFYLPAVWLKSLRKNFSAFHSQKVWAHIIHTSQLNIWQHMESNTSN